MHYIVCYVWQRLMMIELLDIWILYLWKENYLISLFWLPKNVNGLLYTVLPSTCILLHLITHHKSRFSSQMIIYKKSNEYLIFCAWIFYQFLNQIKTYCSYNMFCSPTTNKSNLHCRGKNTWPYEMHKQILQHSLQFEAEYLFENITPLPTQFLYMSLTAVFLTVQQIMK